MEALLPILLTILRSPEFMKLAPMLISAGGSLFPNLPESKLPAATATLFDVNGTKWTQTVLRKLGEPIDIDGVYGEGTKAAVKKFQEKNGLVADGWAGEKTVEALRQALLA